MACEWRPFALFVVMFSVSSGIATGLMTFVPLYLVDDRGATPAAANVMTSVLLAAAAAGTVLGGYVSHRLGRRFVFVVPQTRLRAGDRPAAGGRATGPSCPLVAVAGSCSSANMAVAVVSAQEYLPSRMGLATGLTMGVCGGVGGLIVAALGPLGDAAGPRPCSTCWRRCRWRSPCSPHCCRGPPPARTTPSGACGGRTPRRAGRTRCAPYPTGERR